MSDETTLEQDITRRAALAARIAQLEAELEDWRLLALLLQRKAKES